ncbi:hypothetical protein FQR65_LT08710 [Abscondita terminalis]|nr:hypothetical protein FQR65_LT08710 [Abscondita terminalis]
MFILTLASLVSLSRAITKQELQKGSSYKTGTGLTPATSYKTHLPGDRKMKLPEQRIVGAVGDQVLERPSQSKGDFKLRKTPLYASKHRRNQCILDREAKLRMGKGSCLQPLRPAANATANVVVEEG